MKKSIFILFMFFAFCSTTQALSWAYPFVVWKGNVYEVTDEDVIKVENVIGEVKSKPDDRTGDYIGDASNIYPVGTKYYEISGVSPSDALAVVVEEGKWKKAVFVHKAQTHWTSYVFKAFLFFIVLSLLIAIVISIKNSKD
ncbi:hypothetical protein [Bacillus sp. S/N-304-OC-R1]|uniref:hypothetical protein n=1 Tax=Bacillus sp. S/N-304-OC-R1 TaxID=2758034 RepID=UPI001C8DFFAD|nr:hypothetical protein [Bacillus sp. S/N-304-OC-R1]MBY0123053.1 hypothetical protein [Bacillus sp. S/N-304-OC-R1]